MANLSAQPEPSPTKTTQPSGMEATTLTLRRIITQCAGCRHSLDGHTYRFFSRHPDAITPAAHAFEAAAEAGDWAAIDAMQTPSVDQPHYVVYAIACPGPSAEISAGGMVAMLHIKADPATAAIHLQQSLSPHDFATLRALCPTCQWIAFSPALQSGQETV